MILITFIDRTIIVTADRLISGDLIVKNFAEKTLVEKKFYKKNYITHKVKDVESKKLKIELITSEEKYIKIINYN